MSESFNEVKDATTNTRAVVKSDGTDNGLVVIQNSAPKTTVAISQTTTENDVDANITNASIAITATDLDTRDLSHATDSVNAIVGQKAGSTALVPNYAAYRLTSKATTTVTSSTCYLSTLVICVSAAGTSMSITVRNKEGTPIIVYYVSSASAGTTQPVMVTSPILMTGGIDIVIGGTTAGTVNVFLTYWA